MMNKQKGSKGAVYKDIFINWIWESPHNVSDQVIQVELPPSCLHTALSCDLLNPAMGSLISHLNWIAWNETREGQDGVEKVRLYLSPICSEGAVTKSVSAHAPCEFHQAEAPPWGSNHSILCGLAPWIFTFHHESWLRTL